MWFWDSINLEQHPNAAEKLRSAEVFTRSCPFCGVRSIEPYPVACYDLSKKILVQFEAGEYTERFFHLDEMMEDGLRLCRVFSPERLAEKVLALHNGRDDRLVEMCKYWFRLKLIIRRIDFDVVRFYYDVDDGEEMLVGEDAYGFKDIVAFPEKEYRLFDKAFREVLPLEMGKYSIYDIAWADSFIKEHKDLFSKTFAGET